MSELINNLQQIYNAKLSIKAAIGTQSDELADYASYITALKPNGYTYINENGDFNVSSYEYAYVNVPTGGGSGSGDVIFLNSIQASDFQNLDGMNNLLSYNGVYCYALNQETFTKRYPTQGYLYSLPSMLRISKDDNVNAYLFEATSFASRTNSYSAAYNNGAGDISVIDQNPEAITSNDQFTGRLTFLYNTYQLRAPKIMSTSGVARYYQNGPFCNEGINVDPSIGTASNSQVVIEHIPFEYDKETSVMRTGDLGLTNFGSYVVFGENGIEFKEMFDELNHMTYDCLLQRTSYKGGFGDGKYECVFVDTYNYVGELQQPEIYGVKYGSDQFDYDSDTQCYTYVITLPANGNIQARTTYFEFDVTSSSLTNYERFLFCEDINGTTPQPLDFKISKLDDEITEVKVGSKSPYVCKVGSRYPSYYMQNRNNDEITFKLSINKNTWRVSSELYSPMDDGIYMKLYDNQGQYEYIECYSTSDGGDGEDSWTEYSFNYDKTKGSGYTFEFVKFENNAIVSYGSAPAENTSIWYYNSGSPIIVEWDNTDPGAAYRFNYPSQSEVDDQGAIIVTYGDKEVAWMNIGAES